MAISWTLILLGALLQGMLGSADENSTPEGSKGSPSVNDTIIDTTTSTVPHTSQSTNEPTASSASAESTTLKPTTSPASLESSTLATTLTSLEPTKLATTSSSPDSSTQAATRTPEATSPHQTTPSLTVANQDQDTLVTTQITTTQPPNTETTFNNPESLTTTVITTNTNQGSTILNNPTATISTKVNITQHLSTQTNSFDDEKNSTLTMTEAPYSKSTTSQSFGTTKAQSTPIIPGQRTEEDTTSSTSAPQNSFKHSFDLSNITKDNIVGQACKTLGQTMKGNCSVTWKINGNQLHAELTIIADQTIPTENYKTPKPNSGDTNSTTFQKKDVNKDTIPDTLIAILASCGALVLILCCFAAYCTYHRRSYRKNQQHLTEELQTVENGYHDNPTLEVMEVQPEMQEKKLTMNGEFNDSWIVPLDNLLKEDIPDEEDTHL